MDIKGKKIVVVGLGISGKAACLFLNSKGARVYASDAGSSGELKEATKELSKKGITIETGTHSEDFIKGAELMVVSPGVSDKSKAIEIADKLSMPIVAEIELASWFCPAPMIAVTGTNGKSTTVTLTGLMLKESGKDALVCGNIGEAFCDHLYDIGPDKVIVLEVSSFQLKRIRHFKPKAAAITNITQNHFDWHLDFKEYFDSKKNICKNQQADDFTILNYDDENLMGLKNGLQSKPYFFSRERETTGAYYEKNNFILNINGKKEVLFGIKEVKLKGAHNISNILCSLLCAYFLGATTEGMKKAVSEFKGLKHRFEDVAVIDNIKFIDDSKATTVDAAAQALLSLNQKAVLIAGGRDKGSDFTKIRDLIEERVSSLVLIGEAKDKIKEAMAGCVDIVYAADMYDAVSLAFSRAKSNSAVLLSPMCASFDMFKDYGDRGDAFCKAIEELKTKNSRPTTNDRRPNYETNSH